MKVTRNLVLSSVAALMIVGLMSATAFAAEIQSIDLNCANSSACSTNPDLYSTLRLVINTLSALIGVVAVMVIIISGFTFATSGGDAKAIETAKSRIIFAVIGIIVVLLAVSIVNFVLRSTPQ